MTPLSRSVSYGLRLSVGILLTFSNLLLLIAIPTNHWVSTVDGLYAGIWKVCNAQFCTTHTNIIHAKVFMVFFLIINILTNIYVIFSLWVAEEDSKKLIGKTSLFNALLGIGGMVSATVFFILASDRSGFLYGFALGWLGTSLVVASGIVSLVHAALEPDKPSTIIQTVLRGTNDPPPYPGPQAAPNTIIVS